MAQDPAGKTTEPDTAGLSRGRDHDLDPAGDGTVSGQTDNVRRSIHAINETRQRYLREKNQDTFGGQRHPGIITAKSGIHGKIILPGKCICEILTKTRYRYMLPLQDVQTFPVCRQPTRL